MADTLCALNVGERGHIFMWHAKVRGLASRYKKVIVASHHDLGPLFDDFAHEFRGVRLGCDSDMDGPYEPTAEDIAKIGAALAGENMEILARVDSHYVKAQQEGFVFRKFGRADPKYAGMIVLHARGRALGADHNWAVGKWPELINSLRSRGIDNPIAFIGRPDLSTWCPGGMDLRGMEFSELLTLLRNAAVIVGPSSGPIHLASQCGCKQVTWNGDEGREADIRQRYMVAWNPFGTPCKVLDRWTWQPTVEEVASATKEMLDA